MKVARLATFVLIGALLAGVAFACGAGRGAAVSPSRPQDVDGSPGNEDSGGSPASAVLESETKALAELGFAPWNRAAMTLATRLEERDGGASSGLPQARARAPLAMRPEGGCLRVVVVSDARVSVRILVGTDVGDVERAAGQSVPGRAASLGPICGRANDTAAAEMTGTLGANVSIVTYSLK